MADILEHELEDAFPVKNKESLHRYISLLTQNYLKRESIQQNHREHQELRSDIQLIASRMEEGFKRMDVRFEVMEKQMNQRFEAVDKRFESVDKKFESLDKRFNRVNFFLAFGFTVVTVLITVYQFLT